MIDGAEHQADHRINFSERYVQVTRKFPTATAIALALVSMGHGVAGAGYLQDYNLIVTGNLDSNSEVQGRTIVGGNLTGGSSNYAISLNPAASKSINTLIIGGNIDVGQGGNINLNAGSMIVGGGKLSGNVNNNGGGTLSYNNASALSYAPAAAAEMQATSTYLDGLAANSTVSLPGSQPAPVIFQATPNSQGVAIFDIAGSVFGDQKSQSYQLDKNGATTFIINVSGTSVLFDQGNFTGDFATAFASQKVLFNFYEATDLTIKQHLFGAVLAPKAHLTNSTAIEGSVFVKSFTQRGEVHLPNYTGNINAVPEPGAIALLAIGLPGAFALAYRRNRKRAA